MSSTKRRAYAMRAPGRAATSLSLRWRVMLLAMSMVAMVVVLMAVAVYAVVSAALYTDIDSQLQSRAQLLIASGSLAADPAKAIEGTAYSDVNAMLINPGRSIYTANQQGQTLPVGQPEKAVIQGELFMSRRTVGDQRVLAIHLPNDSSLLISKSLQPTNAVMNKLKWVLLAVGGIGVVIAAVAGGMVARTGLRPVGQLTDAAERVARTDDLRPIPVFGSDELARLTEAFNSMLRSLAESRERQARLVADAGHELKTPLTSLRTNVELLMASSAPGAPPIPESEMADLREDVIGQIEELSTLVGDLVDLTREDNPASSGFDGAATIFTSISTPSAGRCMVTRPDCPGPCSTCSTMPPSGARPAGPWGCGCARWTSPTPNSWCPTRVRVSLRRSAAWSLSGSTGRPRRVRCPVPAWAWQSSNRWSSNTEV
jgi:two-component system, OmpR family, sensor histidine kinase MprB